MLELDVRDRCQSQMLELDARDRERFKKPRISYTRADGDQIEVDSRMAEIRASETDRLFEKTMAMEMYLLE